MLDKNIFLNCMGEILVAHEIKPDEQKMRIFYDLMKNDFTDDEFQAVCERICKEETLYNKYPTPPMFYKYKTSCEDIMGIECQKFLDKVEDYLNLGFVPSFYKEDFIKNLTDSERRAMQGFGGISELWADCHRDNMPRSKTSILKDLRQSFEMCWKIEEKIDTPLIEQKAEPEMLEKTTKLLSTFKLGSKS